MHRLRKSLMVAVTAAVVVGLAACGSSSSSSSTAASAAGGSNSGSSGGTTPKKLTLGVIPSTSSSENLAIWIAEMKAAAAPLGWTVTVCNGNGNVTTMNNCAESLVTQKVSAIITTALGGPEIPQGFAQAKAANIPVIAYGTSVNPGYETKYTGGVYGDDIVKQGQDTAQYVATHLKGQPVLGLEVTQNYGGQGYVNGEVAGFKALGTKFTDLRDVNLANIVSSIATTTQAELQAHPGKVVFLGFDDIDPSLVQPVFQHAGRSKDVTEIVRYDDQTTVGLMRNGDNILVADTKNYQHIFDMYNALLNHFQKGAAFPAPSTTTNNPGSIVVGIKQYPSGSNRYYQFMPALKAQEAVWAKTYKLQSGGPSAP